MQLDYFMFHDAIFSSSVEKLEKSVEKLEKACVKRKDDGYRHDARKKIRRIIDDDAGSDDFDAI